MEGFMLKEVGNVDEAYRQLAVACVAQACQDYIDHCVTPTLDKHVDIAQDISNECDVTLPFVFSAYEYYTGEGKKETPPVEFLKQIVRDYLTYARGRHQEMDIYQPGDREKWLAAEVKQLEKCECLESVNELAKKIRSKTRYMLSGIQRKNYLWIRDGRRLEKYFGSPQYQLFTNDRADGETIKKELRQQADKIIADMKTAESVTA